MSVGPLRTQQVFSRAAAQASDKWERLLDSRHWNISTVAAEDSGVWYVGDENRIHFPDNAHDTLFQAEDESFWFRHRNNVIERALRGVGMPKSFWEIGAGNGCVARHLQGVGIPVAAVEPMAAGARNAAARGIHVVVCGCLESLRLPDAALPAVGCFDVIEHLEHPETLIGEIRRTLRPGGIFIVTVPAMNWLWSDVDVVSGHFRRYTRSSLRQSVAAQGFEVLHTDYFMMSLALPMFCCRTIPSLLRGKTDAEESLAECQRQMNITRVSGRWSPFEILLRGEAALARIISLPLGTSVIGVFRKPWDTDEEPSSLDT